MLCVCLCVCVWLKCFQTCIGAKILQIKLPKHGVYFNDTYNYLPLSLRNLAAAFSLNIQKGYFPMSLLKTPEYHNTVIEWPGLDAWYPEKLTAANLVDLKQWYPIERERHLGLFDFNHHLEQYCIVSVFHSAIL